MTERLSAREAVPARAMGSLILPEAVRGLFYLWLQRARTRWALRQIEPSLLDDIGITPKEQDREAAKPFWTA